MTVAKHKPTASLDRLMRKQAEIVAKAAHCVQAGRDAIARAQSLMEDSQDAIARAQALRNRRTLFRRAPGPR